MKLYKNVKRTTMQYIIVSIICIVIIGGAAFFTSVVITNQIQEEYKALLKEAYSDMESNKRNVYIAMSEIIAGELITKEKVEKKTVYSSQPQEGYITEKEIGKVAVIDIAKYTQILKTMLTDNLVTSELREMEYEVVSINSNIVSNDAVDIRIFFPNGESYVVLSKKIIKGVTPGTVTCYLWLDEEELLRMSAAIVDAGLYEGTKLITTKYVEPNIQEASLVTYTPSIAILSLLESDPNILEKCSQELNKVVRKALENRLATSMSTDVSAISWNVNPYVQAVVTATPTPVPSPEAKAEADTEDQASKVGKPQNNTEQKADELGSASEENDYFYYTEEAEAKEGVLEYGE